MKPIVITGAAGLVGQNLIPLLQKKEYPVIAIDKNEHNLKLLQRLNPGIQTICADLSEKGEWESAFKGATCVIQLHAQIAAPERKLFVRNNVEAVERVLEVCKRNKIKNLIHLSSSVVISVAKDDYTETKREGEERVHKSGIPHTILRPPLMYGCFDAKHLGWITTFMEKIPIIPIPGSGTYVRQPLYVLDLCQVILRCIERKPANEVWNIIGHEKIPYSHMLQTIAQVKGMKRLFLPLPLPVFSAMLQVYRFFSGKTVFTPDQMKALVAGDEFPVSNWSQAFNVKYTPFEKGIKETWDSPSSLYAKEMVSPHRA